MKEKPLAFTSSLILAAFILSGGRIREGVSRI
jgi:hypothetical protein